MRVVEEVVVFVCELVEVMVIVIVIVGVSVDVCV